MCRLLGSHHPLPLLTFSACLACPSLPPTHTITDDVSALMDPFVLTNSLLTRLTPNCQNLYPVLEVSLRPPESPLPSVQEARSTEELMPPRVALTHD